MPHRAWLGLIIVCLALACSTGKADQSAPRTALPSPQLFTLAHLPSPTVPLSPDDDTPIPQTPFPTNTPVTSACGADTSLAQTRYDLQAVLDWTTKQVTVEQVITYRNDHIDPLRELVFHVEPRRLVGTMSFQGAFDTEGQRIESTTFEGWRLTVPLPTPVDSGCEAVTTLRFNLQLQPNDGTNAVGWLAYTHNQLNLGHWFPTLGIYGYEAPGEWYTPQLHYVGEQSTPSIADFAVHLEVQNAPDGLKIAAPGQITETEPYVWDMELRYARDFALSLSATFKEVSATANGVNIELYYFTASQPDPGARALVDAQQALTLYSELFGPYPYDRLVIVEGDFPDGLEFTGLVFVGEAWFRVWNGQPSQWLTIITVHEVSHQWWYAQVANNQAMTPYLDESLATYSELLYYEQYYPDLIEWWWDFRVFKYPTEAPVDSTVYDYVGVRPYINAVYLRGVMMLQSLRNELGDSTFFAWLYDYVDQYQGEIADPSDFWGVLPSNAYLMTTDIRQQFLRNGNILPLEAATVPTTP